MTTTVATNAAAGGMAWGRNEKTPVRESRPRPAKLPAAIARAAHLYRQTLYSSRIVAAVSFFIAAALAAGNHGNPPSVMFSLLALALLNAAPSGYVARYRFRAEIERVARTDGYSAPDARRLSHEVFAEWSASPLDVVTT